MTALAAFQTLLHRYTGQDDIVVGTPVANRTGPEVQGLIGFFVTSLALQDLVRGDPSFRELLGRVRTMAVDAFAHQQLPFERLVSELGPTGAVTTRSSRSTSSCSATSARRSIRLARRRAVLRRDDDGEVRPGPRSLGVYGWAVGIPRVSDRALRARVDRPSRRPLRPDPRGRGR